MSILTKIIFASLISGLLGLTGGIVLLFKHNWVRKFSLHLISFAVGVLLATAILDLLPEAVELAEGMETHAEDLFIGLLVGIVGFFSMERMIFKFHPHHHGDVDDLALTGQSAHHHPAPTMLLIGDTIHNFIDGVLIAITFIANPGLGILTAVAVAAHELPQEFSDFSVMLSHGWSRRRVLWANILSALASVVGAISAFVLRDLIIPFLPQLLSFTAGIFIYIAIADLIPEVTHESLRDKTLHVFALVFLGILSVLVLGFYLEAH